MTIRRERAADLPAIHAVNVAAFGSPAEAVIVDTLRVAEPAAISLVAEEAGIIHGHVMFSPVRIAEAPGLHAMALAPLAVAPDRQRKGIGLALILAGLEECRRAGVHAVFVVGDPAYYTRTGFAPARPKGFACQFDVPDDVFMVVELVPGSLARRSGTVQFHPAFKE